MKKFLFILTLGLVVLVGSACQSSSKATGAVEDRRTPMTVSSLPDVPSTIGSAAFDVLSDPTILAGLDALAVTFGPLAADLNAGDAEAAVIDCTIQSGVAMGLQSAVNTYSGPVAAQLSNFLDEVVATDVACVGHDWTGAIVHLDSALAILNSITDSITG